MELWIRSQDKETLLKVDYLYIPISRDKEHFGIYTKIGVRDEYLGIYKTKERALEVLDEIQKRISILETISITGLNDKTVKAIKKIVSENSCSVVYEMPKE